MTSDVDGGKKFYSSLIGWNSEDMPMGDMNYTIFKVGDEGLGGIMLCCQGFEACGTDANVDMGRAT